MYMKKLFRTGLFLLLAGLAMIAAGAGFLRAQGDGPITAAGRTIANETRPITDRVVVINMNGPIDLILKQGATASLVIRGEHRLLPKIKIVQDGDTLTMGTEGLLINPLGRLTAELTLPSLQTLTLNGSGDGHITGFKGERLNLILHGSSNLLFDGNFRRVAVKLMGSGDIKLDNGASESVDLDMFGSGDMLVSGQSKALTAKLYGSGDLSAKRMIADAVTVSTAGSGDAIVNATQSATLSISGSGDIDVAGNPTQRSVKRSGSGSVSWE